MINSRNDSELRSLGDQPEIYRDDVAFLRKIIANVTWWNSMCVYIRALYRFIIFKFIYEINDLNKEFVIFIIISTFVSKSI